MKNEQNMRFQGKVVLVTGAVRNTGLAIAEAFAREGAAVVLNGRREADVSREAERLRREFSADVFEGTADISVQQQVDSLFSRIAGRYGRLDVLVNNAVLQGLGYSVTDTPRELLETVVGVNLMGAFACAQGAARLMTRQKSGTIINIGSNTAERAIRNRSVYVASKAAIDGLTRALAVELGPLGVRVNMVVAGYIRTNRWDSLADGVEERRLKNVPLHAEAHGSDIADAVLFLASDSAARINGAKLPVDGGSLAQLYPADCDA